MTDYVNVSSGTYYIKITKESYSGVPYSICVTQKHDHVGSWLQTTLPTCTEWGTEQRICAICGDVETRDVEATEHNYDDGNVIKVAGIAQKGETQFTCKSCGDQYIEKDGHLLWGIPVICVGGVLALIGFINYIE